MASWTGACAGRAAADCDARATTRAASVSPNAARTSEETGRGRRPGVGGGGWTVGWVGWGRGAKPWRARNLEGDARGAYRRRRRRRRCVDPWRLCRGSACARGFERCAPRARARTPRRRPRPRPSRRKNPTWGRRPRADRTRPPRVPRPRPTRGRGGRSPWKRRRRRPRVCPHLGGRLRGGCAIEGFGLGGRRRRGGDARDDSSPSPHPPERTVGRFDIGPAPPRARGARAFEISTTSGQ